MAYLVWLLLPVWESWGAPLGRWGGHAFPMVHEGRIYVADGRRVWRFSAGRWEEFARLPEEVRSGVALGADTLLLGGLGEIYWLTGQRVRSISVENTGWIYRMWRLGSSVALRGVQASLLARMRGDTLTLTPVDGDWLGAAHRSFFLRRKDSLYTYPEWRPLTKIPSPAWIEVSEVRRQLWGISQKGELISPTRGSSTLKGVRAWISPFVLTERAIWTPGSSAPFWEGRDPIYHAAYDGGLLAVLTPTELVLIYAEAPIFWVMRWSAPITQASVAAGRWIVWQGETAFSAEGTRRYPATLIEPVIYQGEWLWATPRGILRQNGQPFAAPGRYINAIAVRGDKVAWASGTEVIIRTNQKEESYKFPQPIRKLGWTGDTLRAWRAQSLYTWYRGSWRLQTLPFLPEEVVHREGHWYFRVGANWLQLRGARWDTLNQLPGTFSLPLAHAWGRVLHSFSRRETTFVITSLGLLAVLPDKRTLPPIVLSASLTGPALKGEKDRLSLPAERPFVELSWQANAAFIPTALRAYYQIGDDPPVRLVEPKLIFSLSRPGTVRLRFWVEHPWYPQPKEQVWIITVTPPWYETWWARGAAILTILGIAGGLFYLREWNLRRLQRHLTAERERLLAQTQRQQSQILQAERMANLGVMSAHIAHEINTPLGVIQSALAESLESLAGESTALPLPVEPRPSAVRVRELRNQWQATHPHLPPAQIQQLALMGYSPDQMETLRPYMESAEKWESLLRTVKLHQALRRAAEAADKLHARVQSIRTYVRGIEDSAPLPILLADSLKATVEFYRPMLRRVEVQMDFPDAPLYVRASPARLEQVWANLIQNALQAMPDGGKLTLRIESKGEKVWIYIQDTGKGIPPHLKEAIFEPLFTTKAPGEGTGLGLPLCKQIVETYGGTLKLLHSEPGYTLFGVELPLCEPPETPETGT